jgi:hypothetical protein
MKRRSLRTTLFELLLPLLFFAMLLMLKTTMPPEYHAEQRIQRTYEPSYSLTTFVGPRGILYYAPYSTNKTTMIEKVIYLIIHHPSIHHSSSIIHNYPIAFIVLITTSSNVVLRNAEMLILFDR